MSTWDHIALFTTQCKEASNNGVLKMCLFASSLTGPAFKWYINLTPGSVYSWQAMEELLHSWFYKAEPDITIADLVRVSQRLGQSVHDFISRFQNAKLK